MRFFSRIVTIGTVVGVFAASMNPLVGQDKEGKGDRFREMRRSLEGKPGDGKPGIGRPGMPGGAGGGMLQAHPLFVALDADRDGKLSALEIQNATKALLKLDRNGDGVLSSEELRPDFAAMREGGPGDGPRPGDGGQPTAAMMLRMLESRDTNGDGKLSGDEIPERMRERVNMIDQDGDGAIDKNELRKASEKLMDRVGERGERSDKDGSGVKPKRPEQP